jgi:hypothetical protein
MMRRNDRDVLHDAQEWPKSVDRGNKQLGAISVVYPWDNRI